MQRGIHGVRKMLWMLGVVFMLGGCVLGAGGTPAAARTPTATFAHVPTAPTTVTPRPTATVLPRATPVPKPVWGKIWKEVPCSWQPKSVPEGIRGAGPGEETWYGLSGRRLVPIPMEPGRWLPLRYDFQDGWSSAGMEIVNKADTEDYPRGLTPTPWGAIEDDGELNEVMVYDWVTKRVYCLKRLGSTGQEDGGGLWMLMARGGGVMLWEPEKGKMYGLRGRGLEVAWEAPYKSIALTAARKAYKEVWYYYDWKGWEPWNLLVRARTKSEQEVWSTEGYDVATGAHQYVQLSPRPWGAWGDWTWKDIKYSWDNKALALLQWYHPTNEFRILVYPLGECMEDGDTLCEPKVYPLTKKYLDWERACQYIEQIFWSPKGDALYLSMWGDQPNLTPSWCEKKEYQVWKLDVRERGKAWEEVELKPTEGLLKEAKKLHNPLRLGASLHPIAWDGGRERLLVKISRGDDYHYYVYAWLYLEPKDKSRMGVMEPMRKEEVPFGLILPWSFEEEQSWR